MMPSRGLAPFAGSIRAFTSSARAQSRLISTIVTKPITRPSIRSRFQPQRAFIQQRNISWSPNTWFGSSSQPSNTFEAAHSKTAPENATAAASSPLPSASPSTPSSSALTNGQVNPTIPSSVPATPSPDTLNTAQTPVIETQPATSTAGVTNLNLDTIENVNISELSNVPERIGFLKEIGLDYGWGPTSMLEWTLEHVHVWSGMPWWGSIIVTALLLRLAMFPLFLQSSEISARMQALRPLTQPLTARMTEAYRTGDHMAVQRAQTEMSAMYKRADIRMSRMFAPMVLQAVFAFCALKLMRAMAALPVPGFYDGGALWFSDLTIADPTLGLPFLMATSMHFIFRMGGEMGNQMIADNPALKTVLLWVLPTFVFISMAWFPAAVNVWLATTGLFGIVQGKLLQNPTTRDIFGLSPIIKDPSKAKTDNVIDVKAVRKPATGVQYQAPNRPGAAEPTAATNKVKGWFVDKANDLGTGFDSMKDQMRTQIARFTGEKTSRTRSSEYLKRAAAYERRVQEEKARQKKR